MKNKQKIKELLDRLNTLQGNFPDDTTSLVDKIINQEVTSVSEKLRENVTIKSIDKLSTELARAKKSFDLTPIVSGLKELEETINNEQKSIVSNFEAKLGEIKKSLTSLKGELTNTDQGKFDTLAKELNNIQEKFSSQISENQAKYEVFRQELTIFEDKIKVFNDKLEKNEDYELHQQAMEKMAEEIEIIRTETMSRLANMGGGSPNQQINVNSSVMSTRYADINFGNAGNIGWTATNDDTNRRVNITASILVGGGGGSALTIQEADGVPTVSNVSTIVVSNGTLTDDGGGQVTVTTGGGGGGITRTTSVLSVSSTMAAAASTDYVFFPNVGIRLTLPTAVNNSNSYTVKNFSASSILVAAPTGQDIDGSATALMPTQNESLSFISNNSVWGVV